jgi:imidazolonepropionase-like amidohydrolase
MYHPEMASELHRLQDAGVLLTMGAHGQRMGLGAHWEMELFTHGGFTPLEALRVATINGFRHQGLDRDLGSIETGKLADLVVLEHNPLDDIRNTRSVRYVVQNGVVFDGADLARVHPDPRPAEPMYFLGELTRQ